MSILTPTLLRPRHYLLALCLTIALAPAWAQKRVALVMGNAKYQQEAELRNPLNDARLLERTLKDKPLRFDEVLTLNNGTRAQMLQQLARFGKLAQGAEVAVLYYSGHGMINSRRQNHLLPVDMPKISANADLDTDAALKSYSISETDLIEAVEGAKVQVVVLDACRDNGFGGQKSGSKGLARRADQSKNRLIAYATEEGFTAEDGKGQNSTYALSLARHLVRTDLPLLTVFDEVANDVERQTANKQSPTRSGNLRTSVYLLASLVPEPVQPAQPRPVSPSPAPVPAPNPTPVVTPVARCTDCPQMVDIPAGSFVREDGKTVSLAAFAMAQTETTTAQYMACVADKACKSPEWAEAGSKYHLQTGSDTNYRGFTSDSQPVVGVSWDNAREYAAWVSRKTGQRYHLPSEAQWEYAARAGTRTQHSWGDSIGKNNANCDGCGSRWDNKTTAPVGQFKPNAFGLHDMHGNVWEWVQDCYVDNYSGAPVDGRAAGQDTDRSCSRVLRGGGWNGDPANLRSADRNWNSPGSRYDNIGFRLARTLLTP